MRGIATATLTFAYNLDDMADALGLGHDDEITDDQLNEQAEEDFMSGRHEWEIKREAAADDNDLP